MPTAPVIVIGSGVSFTVNVTVANLDPLISIRDFVVLENGILTANTLSYTKTTATSIQYSGPSITGGTTIEIRRNTPRDQRTVVVYGTKVRSADWNTEFDRRVRIQEEMDLYGAGGGFSVRLPLNTVYGLPWSTDTLFSPTRQALYNKFELTAPLAAPTFTGLVTIPTPLTVDNSTAAASTAYVKANLLTYAPLTSPSLLGVPVAPTPLTADNSTTIATTAYVKSNLAPYLTSAIAGTTFAPLASPTFTGVPIVPTFTDGVKTTQAINALNLQRRSRPVVIARRTTALTLNAAAFTDIVYDQVITDTSSTYNNTTGVFTAPYTGAYEFKGLSSCTTNQVLMSLSIGSASVTELARLGNTQNGQFVSGSTVELLNAGDTRRFMVYNNAAGTSIADSGTARNSMHMSIHYLGIVTAA
jgi:hypothetical protein